MEHLIIMNMLKNIVLYIYEFIILFIISKKILNLPLKRTIIQFTIFFVLNLSWIFYIISATRPFPNTFIFLFLLCLYFSEAWQTIICIITTFALLTNLISNIISLIYTLFTNIHTPSLNLDFYSDFIALSIFFISIIIIDIFHIQLPNIKEYITTKTTIIIVTNNIACFLLSEIYTLTLYYNVPITGRIIATFSIYVIVIFANFLISFML